ncbi:MAG: hypothetical protein ABH863_01215 [Candidatus Micrarchaeota archaeon]
MMADSIYAILDLLSIGGWILIGIAGMILRDILKDAKSESSKLRWSMMYLILPLLLLYPTFLFYQYLFGGDVPLSKSVVTSLTILMAIGSLLLLYLAHQVRLLQLRRELSGVAASLIVAYLGLSVYLSFQLSDFGDVLNNLLFTTAMMMLSLSMFYFANYALAFSKVVHVSRMLYIAGVMMLLPGVVNAFVFENRLLNLFPHPIFLKIIGTIGILSAGMLMFIAGDKFKQRVLEFDVRLK